VTVRAVALGAKFICLSLPHMGYMSEQKKLTMFAQGASSYIDVSSALTAINRKQYHQVTRKGVPLVYDCTITFMDAASTDEVRRIATLLNNWTVRNSVVKTSAAWKKQLRSAGIRMKDLSKYGRRLRIPFDEGMSTSGTGSMYATFAPYVYNTTDGILAQAFTTYTAPSGDTVSYAGANEFTRFAIPDAAGGDAVEMNIAMLGHSDAVAANNYFGVIDEYLGSRGGIIDEPGSAQQLPDADNLLQTMFSSTQPSTDEVVEAVEDFGEYRPYPDGELDATAVPITATNLCEFGADHGLITNQAALTVGVALASLPFSIRVQAPLGLIKVDTGENKDTFIVDVHRVYEM